MNDIARFMELTESLLTDDEKISIGIGTQEMNRRKLDEAIAGASVISYNSTSRGRPLKNILDDKDSDGEIIFFFEDREDAYNLYSFFVDTKLLESGEIVFKDIEGQYSVGFMPSVVIQKPEMIQAAMLAYEDQMNMESEEDYEAYESVFEVVDDILNEKYTTNVKSTAKGNPFHDKNDGKFAGVARHDAEKGGSWSKGKKKLKFSKAKKTKSGDTYAHYAGTKTPCGRDARSQGKDVRCWDGKQGAGFRIAKILKKSRGKKESFDVSDLVFLMEMREELKKR